MLFFLNVTFIPEALSSTMKLQGEIVQQRSQIILKSHKDQETINRLNMRYHIQCIAVVQ